MSLESTVAELVRRATDLLQAVNIRKLVLDEKADEATEAAGTAVESANTAGQAAGIAEQAANIASSSATVVSQARVVVEAARTAVVAALPLVEEARDEAVAASEEIALIAPGVTTAATTAIEASEAAAEWAAKEVDSEVVPGKYSAMHYASRTSEDRIVVEQVAGELAGISTNMPTFTVASSMPTGTPKDGDIWIYVEQ